MSKKGKHMSREQATELYRDLRKAMGTIQQRKAGNTAPKNDMQDVAKSIAQSISQSIAKDGPVSAPLRSLVEEETKDAITRREVIGQPHRFNAGHYLAVTLVLGCALCKATISGLEASGILTVSAAQASMQTSASIPTMNRGESPSGLSRDEARILMGLDGRRAELEERARKLDDRERELGKRDKEFVGKIQQLHELTETLKIERAKGDKKRSTQLEQLANVYGSMAPQEAAGLIEQLDTTLALPLMERMPEKRIGQILALMSRERALAITKMLSTGR